MTFRIITIDGPAGAGKTTVSRLLAKKLGCVRVDTGALYRAVAFEIHRQQISWKNDEDLTGFLSRLDLNVMLENEEMRILSSGRISLLLSALLKSPCLHLPPQPDHRSGPPFWKSSAGSPGSRMRCLKAGTWAQWFFLTPRSSSFWWRI